jgi:hypothetical protein
MLYTETMFFFLVAWSSGIISACGVIGREIESRGICKNLSNKHILKQYAVTNDDSFATPIEPDVGSF